MNLTSNVSASFVKAIVFFSEIHSRDVFVNFPSNGYKICYAVMFAAVNIILIIPTVLLNDTSVIAIFKCSQLNTKVFFLSRPGSIYHRLNSRTVGAAGAASVTVLAN